MNEFVDAVEQFFTASEWRVMDTVDRYKFAKYYYIYYSCIDLGKFN